MEYIFADFCYLNTYDLVEESGFVINAKKDFEAVMIIDEDDSLLITDSEDNMIEHLSFEFGDDKFVTFSGSSGIYNINSLGDVKIKAMAINILGYVPVEIFCGHYHRMEMLNDNNTDVVVNGSVMGTDSYAMKHRLNTKPHQILRVYNGDDVCTYKTYRDSG